MKILMVVDISFWAIGHLAQAIINKNPHIQFELFEYPPREIETKFDEFRMKVKEFNPDLIHFHYWNVCNFVLQNMPELSKYKKILTHHNQKDLLHGDWKDLNLLIVHTQRAKDILVEAGYNNVGVVQHGIDMEYWRFNENWPPKEFRLGYVGRIVKWKGMKELVKVCKEFKVRFLAMTGNRIEKPQYIQEINQEVGGDFEAYGENMMNIADEDRQSIYDKMTFYVGNSRAGLEEGPLGLLEAMASGVPVITTPSGEAADIIEDGKNGFFIEFENYDSLKNKIKECKHKLATKEGVKEFNKIRENAWKTVKDMSENKMGYLYQLIYYNLIFQDEPLVSIILPVYNRLDNVKKILDDLQKQDYKNLEVVICDDFSDDGLDKWYKENNFNYSFILKYINTKTEGYNLAMARNMGVIEASGEYLVFLDSRLSPKQFGIVSLLVPLIEGGRIWSFGKKGDSGKQSFVENWSAIRREHFINAGMCNERINKYGGMSQELRSRFQKQGFVLQYCEDAEAAVLSKTSKKKRRKDIIDMKFKLLKMRL